MSNNLQTLSVHDRNRWEHAAGIIRQALQNRYDAGEAILDIRDSGLWKKLGYKTLEACLYAEFGLVKRTAYDYLNATEVRNNLQTELSKESAESALSKGLDINDPPVSHALTLHPLSPKQQAKAVMAAVELAGDGEVTEKIIKKAVQEICPSRAAESKGTASTPPAKVAAFVDEANEPPLTYETPPEPKKEDTRHLWERALEAHRAIINPWIAGCTALGESMKGNPFLNWALVEKGLKDAARDLRACAPAHDCPVCKGEPKKPCKVCRGAGWLDKHHYDNLPREMRGTK